MGLFLFWWFFISKLLFFSSLVIFWKVCGSFGDPPPDLLHSSLLVWWNHMFCFQFGLLMLWMRNFFLGGLQSLNHPVMNRIRWFLLANLVFSVLLVIIWTWLATTRWGIWIFNLLVEGIYMFRWVELVLRLIHGWLSLETMIWSNLVKLEIH